MTISPELTRLVDEAVSHYPNPARLPDEEALKARLSPSEFAAEKERVRLERKRSAALPLLHLFQEHFGFVSNESMSWIAQRLELQPINILELVTFYPMFRREPAGKKHIRVCRTPGGGVRAALAHPAWQKAWLRNRARQKDPYRRASAARSSRCSRARSHDRG